MKSNRVSTLTTEIRISAISILKNSRKFLVKNDEATKKKLIDLCEDFTKQLQTVDSLYVDPESKKTVGQMLSYVDSLRLVITKALDYNRDRAGLASISEFADKILEAFSDFQQIQYAQASERDGQIKDVIAEIKKNMMITLIIVFLATILFTLIIPGSIALPFKKIKDAIRELQDCNFDVSIFYNQDDEIGEIAEEMNKMIHNFKVFDELRTDRINIERRKFDALANLTKRPVLVANADGNLVYMNNILYDLLQVSTEDVMGKPLTDKFMPESIIHSFELAVKRRSKIENAEVIIPRLDMEDSEGESKNQFEDNSTLPNEVENDDKIDGEDQESSVVQEVEPIFKGFANVIPIRGKESSLDYYLMVLSREVFA